MNRLWSALCVCGLVGCNTNAAKEADTDRAVEVKAADNSGKNVRDQEAHALTPMDQGNDDADVKITADIRKQVMDIEGLSTDAQNIKIITTNGMVTLRGPVDSAEEKSRVEQVAKAVAGASKVNSQIEVASK